MARAMIDAVVTVTVLVAFALTFYFLMANGIEKGRAESSTRTPPDDAANSSPNCTYVEYGYPFPECTKDLINSGFREFMEGCSFGYVSKSGSHQRIWVVRITSSSNVRVVSELCFFTVNNSAGKIPVKTVKNGFLR